MLRLVSRRLRVQVLRTLRIPRVNESELSALQDSLLYESSLSANYLVLVVGSCVIATLGLLSNSAAVIIGAMIIAPLMLPIRGIALGALEGNIKLFRTSSYAIAMGTGVGIGVSCVIGWMVDVAWGGEIMARTQPNLLDLGVALAAGVVGTYARVRRQIADSLAGVAIAVALMPPVCVVGLGLSRLDWAISLGALLLYSTNLLGISLASMLTFLALGYAPFHKARSALLWTLGLVGVLALPLGASLSRLLAQAELETALRTALLRGTVTFQQVELLDSQFNWVPNPPEVILVVRSNEPVTTKQVSLLEQFVRRATGQAFRLIFQVSQTQEVRGDLYPPPTPSPLPDPLPPTLDPSPSPSLLPSPSTGPEPGSQDPNSFSLAEQGMHRKFPTLHPELSSPLNNTDPVFDFLPQLDPALFPEVLPEALDSETSGSEAVVDE